MNFNITEQFLITEAMLQDPKPLGGTQMRDATIEDYVQAISAAAADSDLVGGSWASKVPINPIATISMSDGLAIVLKYTREATVSKYH